MVSIVSREHNAKNLLIMIPRHTGHRIKSIFIEMGSEKILYFDKHADTALSYLSCAIFPNVVIWKGYIMILCKSLRIENSLCANSVAHV